jgi:hypothetical protein
VNELLADLGSHLPVWRVNAQDELIRRGAKEELKTVLRQVPLKQALETWAAWTLGRKDLQDESLDSLFARLAASNGSSLNLRLQSIVMAQRRNCPI